MANYSPPGVTIQERVNANVAPRLATPDTICLVGPVNPLIKGSSTVTLTDAAGTATTTNSSKTVTITATTAGTFAVGQSISGSGIPASTYITNVSGSLPSLTLTLNNSATASSTTAALTARGAQLIPTSAGSISAITKVTLSDTTKLNLNGGTYDSATGYTTASYDFAALVSNTTNVALDGNSIARKVSAASGNAQIDDNTTITVEYTYTPANFYDAQRFDNVTDIESKYGSAYLADQKTINSPISLAAKIAFENNASDIIIQPLFKLVSNTKTKPTNAEAVVAAGTWDVTLAALRSIDNVGLIAPVIGQSSAYSFDGATSAVLDDDKQKAIFKAVQDHIQYQQTINDNIIIGIFGEDGTVSVDYGNQTDLQAHAQSLRDSYGGAYSQQAVLISPSRYTKTTPSGSVIDLGGQYVAAAICGKLASSPTSMSLTRKNIIGLTSVTDIRTKQQKNDDASNGLFVIEQKGALIQIRHALTTDNTGTVARSELSVVRAKQKLVNSVNKTLDEQIIGTTVADNNAPLVVASAVTGVLNRMVDDNEIVAFSDVDAHFTSLDPTVIEVRFNYRPAFPVNYIKISFAIDLTSGNLNLSSSTNQVNTGA